MVSDTSFTKCCMFLLLLCLKICQLLQSISCIAVLGA